MTPCQDPLPLNSAVIVRVWPRPFSVWEDNPEDPESIDGYFLLDVNEQQAQDDCAVLTLMTVDAAVYYLVFLLATSY